MPRAKSFNPELTLRRAMELFWEKGFDSTSIADLESHLGLGRVSIYGAYGDKQQLFLRCLELYRRDVTSPLLRTLDTENGLEGIRLFFARLMRTPATIRKRGCFIVNALVSANNPDPKVHAAIQEHIRFVTDKFAHAARRAQLQGSIGEHVRPNEAAAVFVSLTLAMFTLSRGGANNKLADEAVRSAISWVTDQQS